MQRRFEIIEGKSSKFWEISTSDKHVTVRFGRIGSVGQSTTKSFDTPVLVGLHANKLIAQKLKKGYSEVACG